MNERFGVRASATGFASENPSPDRNTVKFQGFDKVPDKVPDKGQQSLRTDVLSQPRFSEGIGGAYLPISAGVARGRSL
jgi:hypothetical protein